MKSSFTACLIALTLFSIAQPLTAASGKPAPAPPDKAYAQKIWDGWATLNPDNVAKFYAPGPNTFFDIAPLKYNSWEEYYNGSKALIANYKSATFTLNDDFAVHPHGDLAWVTATVKFEMTHKTGKIDMGTMRWTAVFENHNGKWLAVHEHVSVPMQ